MKYPRGLVDKNDTETLGVVGFEDLNHKFDRRVILDHQPIVTCRSFGAYHVCHGEVSHIEDDALGLIRIPSWFYDG